jgi:hypothetical protein
MIASVAPFGAAARAQRPALVDGWKVQLDALNLFNTKANQIMYAYGSLLRSDPLYAQCKSATPPPLPVCLAVRLMVTGVF